MKIKNLILGIAAAAATLVACQEKNVKLGIPDIDLSETELSFDIAGGEKSVVLTATRDWKVNSDVDWLVFSPESGTAPADETIVITALENTGLDRTADIQFTIGMKSEYLTITQEGPQGSAEDLILYYNDYDKVVAEKTYGSGSSWPYLDQFDGWMNETGTGAADVQYAYSGMSARANSTSDSSYSDYEGSGNNNMFFGKSAYLATKNIALNGATGLSLSFGSEKYSQDLGSVFLNSEFHIFLSNDGKKWVELTDYTFAGGTTEGRWNVASADFSVPEGTEHLSICMQVDAASSYRMDDLKLVISEGGAAVDFSTAVEKDFAAGGTSGGGNDDSGNQGGGESDGTAIYSNNYDKTAATKTYGSGSSWPYLDQFEGWKNAAGSGAANVNYTFSGVSARNNSNSNGSYSDYAGSGLNNIFFGTNAYFSTNNIALNGATKLTLTFGGDKYSQSGDSKFSTSEYHVFLSNDGAKWVELPYQFAGTADGRWNVATANFTVPSGTSNLSICMQVDVASVYRLDDFTLVAGTEAGTVIDFTQGVAKDFGQGGTSGGDPVTPPAGDGSVVTIAEFLANGGSAIEGIVISNMSLNNLTSKKGMYIQDETAGLQFYLAENHSFAFGDKVRVDVAGLTVGDYNGAVQISGLALSKITKLSSGNTVTPKTVTITDFLANKYEGQYIAISGVQVAASDLSKKFVEGDAHTSINMEDANGNKFVVFSSKYASYGSTIVPQGSGVIKGISSISKGAMQIIFAQDSDYAGLTGARFDGTTPPSGGDTPGGDNTGGNTGGDTPGGDNTGGGQGGTDTPAGGALNSSLTWALGSNAYDSSSSASQKGTINGESVTNILKLGKSTAGGSATVTIPSGVTKIGFYAVAWKGASAVLKCTAGSESKDYNLAANTGATGNPPYTITVAGSDYYTFDVPAGATSLVFATEGTSNCRVLIFGVNPVTE